MRTRRTARWIRGAACALALTLAAAGAGTAAAHHEEGEPVGAGTVLLLPASGGGAAQAVIGSGVLAQVRVKSKQGYNSDYIFGLSRGVADSTLVPALKPLFFILTVPLDLVILPFAVIGGFFG